MRMGRTCLKCSKELTTEDKRQKYCCIQCAYQDRKSNKLKVSCEHCGKDVYIFPSRAIIKHHFCNMECQTEWQKTYHLGKNNPQWKGIRVKKTCVFCGTVYVAKTQESCYCNIKCHMNHLNSLQKGETHPAWKGGTTTGRRVLEQSKEYKEFRMQVFRRDNFKCILCNKNNSLCVHHIKVLSLYPELRTSVNNGVTLCTKCHRKTYFKESLFEQSFSEYVAHRNQTLQLELLTFKLYHACAHVQQRAISIESPYVFTQEDIDTWKNDYARSH